MIRKFFKFTEMISVLCYNKTDVFKSDFIHSQNVSAVEVISEDKSCKEDDPKGDCFFLLLLL